MSGDISWSYSTRGGAAKHPTRHITVSAAKNYLAPNVSIVKAEKHSSRPCERYFKFSSEGAFLLPCLPGEVKVVLMMGKRSLPETSLLVQTVLWALGKSQGKWAAPTSMESYPGAGGAQQRGANGCGQRQACAKQHLTLVLTASLNLVLANLRHSLKCYLQRKGNVMQMFNTREMYEYVTVYWRLHQ